MRDGIKKSLFVIGLTFILIFVAIVPTINAQLDSLLELGKKLGGPQR